jgi:hypothetical protein
MRSLLLIATLLLAACDNFAEVQKADTIEAYEAWLTENGSESNTAVIALTRLDELYAERARTEGTVEAYDAYIGRFPKGKAKADFKKAREDLLFAQAEDAGTVEAWDKFTSLCPDAGRRLEFAKLGRRAAEYATKLTISEVRVEGVNLAEDPKGPKDGHGFMAEVTNNGDKAIIMLWFNLLMLDDAGKVLQRKDGPLVSPQSLSRMPIAEKDQVPVKPGETRTFLYTTGELPPGFSGKARLVATRLTLEGG